MKAWMLAKLRCLPSSTACSSMRHGASSSSRQSRIKKALRFCGRRHLPRCFIFLIVSIVRPQNVSTFMLSKSRKEVELFLGKIVPIEHKKFNFSRQVKLLILPANISVLLL